MKMKRQIFVDKKFQIGLAASLSVISAAIISVMVILFSMTAIENNKKLNSLKESQQVLTKNQNEMLKTLISFSKMKDKNRITFSVKKINKDIETNQKNMEKNNALIIEIGDSYYKSMKILIGCIILQSLVVFVLLIKRTHRISGPIFLLNRYIHEIKTGILPEVRPLRGKDDFKELFKNFKEMVEYLRNKI